MKFIIAKLLIKTRLCKAFKIKRDGYRIHFHPSAMSQTVWIDPTSRLEDEKVLEQMLKPKDTFVDVGANVGTLSLRAASLVGNLGTIHSIEAHPTTCEYLRSNVKLNGFGMINVHNCAIGDKSGTLFFTSKPSDDQNFVTDQSIEQSISVPVKRLDDFDLSRVDFLKIDVEGYEKFVIKGATKTLENTETIYFECWDEHCKRYSYEPREIIDRLDRLGFKRFVNIDGTFQPIRDDLTFPRCLNVLATRSKSIADWAKAATTS